MRIGYIGAGNIAGVMARTVQQMNNARNYCVAARDLTRAKAFKKEYGFEKAYGSYEEMLSDENVDLIYIATPHSHHAEHMKLCIQYGKPVLCEKSFTTNAAEAKEVLDLAKKNNVFVTEAIWTRYMPSRKMIADIIANGTIGEIRYVTANLGYHIDHLERIVNPALAGGALLDLGVYTINFARMILGSNIKGIVSSAICTDTGVDAQHNITLTFGDNRMASLSSTISCTTNRDGIIYGTDGYLVIENINNPQSLSIYHSDYQLLEKISVPVGISGYEYEVEAALSAIAEGKTECLEMPHAETIAVMEMMDECRRNWGVIYPWEQEIKTELESY